MMLSFLDKPTILLTKKTKVFEELLSLHSFHPILRFPKRKLIKVLRFCLNLLNLTMFKPTKNSWFVHTKI